MEKIHERVLWDKISTYATYSEHNRTDYHLDYYASNLEVSCKKSVL